MKWVLPLVLLWVMAGCNSGPHSAPPSGLRQVKPVQPAATLPPLPKYEPVYGPLPPPTPAPQLWISWQPPYPEDPLIRYEVRYATNIAQLSGDLEGLPVWTNTRYPMHRLTADRAQAYFIVRTILYVYVTGTTNIDWANPVAISDWARKRYE